MRDAFAGQDSYDARFDWGPDGLRRVGRGAAVVVVVDVLRFTTAVVAAVSRGGIVRPQRWRPATAGAESPSRYTLSPLSYSGLGPGTEVALASPNGATISLEAAGLGAVVLAGCLRNARAVAEAARSIGGPVAVVAAGERWRPEDTLRPALEDMLGAGAILHRLAAANPSPEARVAAAAFEAMQPDLAVHLAGCASGRECTERGWAEDLEYASELDVSRCVPVIEGGSYVSMQ